METWEAQFKREKRNFKEGQDGLRFWPSPRKESRISYFSSSYSVEGMECSSSSNYAKKWAKISWKEQSRKDIIFRTRRHVL